MRSFLIASILSGVSLAMPSFSPNLSALKNFNGTQVTPGGVEDIVIRESNTLNGTYHSYVTKIVKAADVAASRTKAAAVAPLSIDLFNDMDPSIYAYKGPVHAYMTGKDVNGRVCFINGNGDVIYPSSGGSTTPKPITENIAIRLADFKQTSHLKLPIPLISGRIYFANGDLKFFMQRGADGQDTLVQPDEINPKDPSSDVFWGFVEFTYNADGSVFANVSFVDFVGVVASMKLTTSDGSPQQITKALPRTGQNYVEFYSAAGGKEWQKLSMIGSHNEAKRTLSPNKYMLIDSSYFGSYWNNYINQVWSHYSSNTLTIDTQTHGKINCRVNGGTMGCDQGVKFGKPTSADIWGCNSGPFTNAGSEVQKAAGARLCAAFVRTTLLLNGGNVQPGLPSSSYYPHKSEADHTHYYAWAVHVGELDGKGYAFPYDDVNPSNNENAAGTVSSAHPNVLTFYVNGWPN